uniref:Uncharacterized protein n=1 Tax=Brassica oleracea var. oleracea TaxID=109376 RepID=A0A0D3E1M2_BRAOL
MYLDEVTSADVNKNLVSFIKRPRHVERRGERHKHLLALRSKREVVESSRGGLEAGVGCADVVETVLQEVHFEIRLLLQRFQLIDSHLLQFSSRR